MDVRDLKPAKRNPRAIAKGAADGLQTSIKTFGDIAGITWNRRSGQIVSGHQRIKALTELYGNDGLKLIGESTDDTLRLLCPNGDEFQVRVVDWNEETELAANISANNPHIAGKFTVDLEGLLLDLKKQTPETVSDLLLEELLASTIGTLDPGPQIEPQRLSDHLVEILCSTNALKTMQPLLDEIAGIDETTVNIS